MSLMDLMAQFRTRPAAAAAPVQTTSTAVANPTVPSSATPTPADSGNKVTAFGAGGEGSKSPLENFGKLWDIDPTKKAPDSPVPQLQADPTKMMELAGTVDFTKHISSEILAKAQKGDSEALMQVMQGSVQAGFAHANMATTKIVESALTQLNEKYTNDIIPRVLAAERQRNFVTEDNPIFDNPAAAPVVNMVYAQMREKNPTASPAELKKHVSDYLVGFSTLALGQSGKTITDTPAKQSVARGEQDWEKLLA